MYTSRLLRSASSSDFSWRMQTVRREGSWDEKRASVRGELEREGEKEVDCDVALVSPPW